jgi:hypothetical protein
VGNIGFEVLIRRFHHAEMLNGDNKGVSRCITRGVDNIVDLGGREIGKLETGHIFASICHVGNVR